MEEVFKRIDRWNSKFNILRNHQYLRKVALTFALFMIPAWFLLGFDSGTGIIEEALKLLPNLLSGQISLQEWIKQSYVIYGRSFHFSSFTIYGLLFYGLSHHFEKIGLRDSKNSLYTSFLVLFNIGVFEFWYMATFASLQMHRSIIEWFTNDFYAPPVFGNFLFLILGAVTILSVYVESYLFNNKKFVGRLFQFKPTMKILLVFAFCLAAIFFWIYYPFQVKTAVLGGWRSSKLFPQTHYAYKDSALYIPNDLLHLVNLVTKSMFAFTQFYVFFRFKRSVSENE